MSVRSAGRALVLKGTTVVGLDALWIGRASRRSRRSPLVRVAMIHGTPKSQADAFRRQLDWVTEHFRVVDFDTLAGLWRDGVPEESDGRPCVLFTFDDGLASNYEVAAPILESYGARGVFFVVPGFVQCEGEDSRRFLAEHLDPGRDTNGWPEEAYCSMTPEQVGDLVGRGHTVGNHTFSHSRLSQVPPTTQYREIVDGAELLRTWTKDPVEAFAWTFSWDAIDAKSLRTARDAHAFCFSPCPGVVDPAEDAPTLLWRTNVEPHYQPHEYRFMYSGLADGLWSGRRNHLRRTLAESEALPEATAQL